MFEEQNQLIVNTLVELYRQSASWQAIRLTAMHLGSTTGTQIEVYDQAGRLVADSLSGMMRGMHGRHWARVQEERGLTYIYPLSVQGKEVGRVLITHLGQRGLYTTEALVFSRAVRQSAVIAGLIAIVAAILIAGMLARRLTSRLKVLTAAAEKWGQGKFGERVEILGDDELAVLGEAMNRMAGSLAEQSELRRKLTGNISHELRTPLTTIQSYLEAFRDGILQPKRENIEAVLEEAARLGKLVNDLQGLTIDSYEREALKLKQLPLTELVTQEAERIRPLLQQKEITLQIEKPVADFSALADETLVERVISNLLINAYKYTPQKGKVLITFSQGNEEVCVAVADTGIGIDAEHLPYIFERFYRVDPSRTRATGGSGIGLAIVKELMEAMGGRVDVDSKPQHGSCFRLYFKRSK